MTRTKLTPAEWRKVVFVAGIGTVLEWFDFYTYAQLTTTLKKVFFPKSSATAQTLLWWAVYAVGFVVRPLGALLFGTIGDIWGRQVTLRISIIFMASATVVIGILPTYDIGPYTAGVAAPILLTIFRLLQGLALGGEFGPAIVYISELAAPEKRGRLVACLQMSVNVGMVLATALVMILEASLSSYEMQVWGWRIPFLLAFLTGLLGYYLRSGLPEPKTFLSAARAEKEFQAKAAMVDGQGSPEMITEGEEATGNPVHPVPSSKSIKSDTSVGSDMLAEEKFDDEQEQGVLTKLHGHHHNKFPVLRLVMNNWLGVFCHVLYMAWVSAAFYGTVTWLPAQLREAGVKPRETQGIVILSMLTNAAGLFTQGFLFDKGGKAIFINLCISVVGLSTGFGFFRGMWTSPAAKNVAVLACWFLIPLFQYIIGMAMASVVLPATRVYAPLERTTGFSFGYNIGYGVIGGLTPFAVSGIIGDLGPDLKAYAPAFWLLAMGGASVIGCVLMRMYAPRLNKPFVGRIE